VAAAFLSLPGLTSLNCSASYATQLAQRVGIVRLTEYSISAASYCMFVLFVVRHTKANRA
jgi:hypothetical protein